jgi:small nuclear ribonucleoprotein (snRNP)-like protein
MEPVKPFSVLERSLGSNVIVVLKDGERIRGRLLGFDTQVNVVLGDAELVNNGSSSKFKTLVVRGSNIVFISP